MRALVLAFLASAAIAQETPIADLRIDAPAWALDFAVAATDDGAYVAWTDNPFSTNTATAYQMRLASDGTPRLETREVIGQGIARDALAARGDYYAVIGSTIRRSDGTESAQIDNISGPLYNPNIPGWTATVNGDMQVGAVAETVTQAGGGQREPVVSRGPER